MEFSKKFIYFPLILAIAYWLMPIGYIFAADSYILEMPLGGGSSASGPAEYIRLFFLYGLGLVGIVALFAFVYGGVRYMLSGGSDTGVSEGKKWMFGALAGIVLLLSSFLILRTISPDLVALREPYLAKIEIEPPEPPSPQILALEERTGLLPGKTNFNTNKYPDIEQRFNDRAPNDLRQVVNGLPFHVQITSYDQGQHVANSRHYEGSAIYIYIGNMNDEQLRTVLNYLRNNSATDQIICGRMSEYNTLNGKSFAYSPTTNSDHMRHIHFSTFGR